MTNGTKKTMVPMEIAAAVSTRRPELLTPLRNRIERGEVVAREDALALLDLVRDAINEAQADDDRRRALVAEVKSLRAALKGAITNLDKMTARFEGSAVPGDDDDDQG